MCGLAGTRTRTASFGGSHTIHYTTRPLLGPHHGRAGVSLGHPESYQDSNPLIRNQILYPVELRSLNKAPART